jgi:hypothetical protein
MQKLLSTKKKKKKRKEKEKEKEKRIKMNRAKAIECSKVLIDEICLINII